MFGADGDRGDRARARAGGLRSEAGEVFCRHAPSCSRCWEVPSVSDAVLAAEPGPPERAVGRALETAIRAMGEYGDMKSRYTRGHSRRRSRRWRRGRRRAPGAGRAPALVRAAHLHDLGRAGVVLRHLGQAGAADRVRVGARPHAHLLHRADPGAPDVAGAGRRRSRRWRTSGWTAAATTAGCRRRRVPPAARLLAAADAYHAMTEPRAAPAGAARGARRRAAAGARPPPAASIPTPWTRCSPPPATTARAARAAHPAGLTDREVEVLRAAGARPHQQGDRDRARHLDQDRRPPRPAHLREDRRHHPRRGDDVRDAERPDSSSLAPRGRPVCPRVGCRPASGSPHRPCAADIGRRALRHAVRILACYCEEVPMAGSDITIEI